ncbi:MAG: class I SAM-dependent methyltransferase [Pirellulales bacterium]|nr:class I SAM-dependent methyltransferase [Pirellulales bacterium]
MRENVRAFVELAAESFGLEGPVYEFGSYQVETQGAISDLRTCFRGRRYIGCDMRPGPGVDRLEDLAQLSLPDECAQTIVCVDTLEHVFEARRAVEEMIRVLAPGGVLLVAAPLDFYLHNYPEDYWRLSPTCVDRLLTPLAATIVGSQGVESYPHTVFGIGCKAPVPHRFVAGVNDFVTRFQARIAETASQTSWPRHLKRLATHWLRSKGERRRERCFHETRFTLQMPTHAAGDVAHWVLPSASQKTGTRLDLI